MLCLEHSDIKADLVCLGKALSGGFFPISAVLGNDKVFDCIVPGSHGSTYGGNPLAGVTMMESIQVIKDEKLVENSQKMGERIMTKLKNSLNSKIVKEIRGKGLFIGIKLNENQGYKAKDFVYKLLEENLLTKDTQAYVLRLAPALTITQTEADFISDKLIKVINAL